MVTKRAVGGKPPTAERKRMNSRMEKQWCVYILRCADGTLYTGMTNDFAHRLALHRCGKGAKYTRGRAPLEPVYREVCACETDARKREYAVKRLSRAQKLALIAAQGADTP